MNRHISDPSMRMRRGQAVVEFALSLLLVLTLALGIFEVGRLMLVYNALADGAQAGVRYAVTHGGLRSCGGSCDSDGPSGPGNVSNVVATVENVLTAATLPLSSAGSCPAAGDTLGVVVTYLDDQNGVQDRIQVTACYGYVPMLSFLPLTPFNLSSTTVGTINY